MKNKDNIKNELNGSQKFEAKPVGEQALLRNQRGPWLEITAGICVAATLGTKLGVFDAEVFYFVVRKITLLVQFAIFAQLALVCIRRRRRPADFINIDTTSYGKYPGPSSIPVPPINGWKLAVWARLQNSIIGDWVITPFIHQTIGINLIRKATSSLKQTFFPLEFPQKGVILATPNDVVDLTHIEYSFNVNSNWTPSCVRDYTDAYKNGTKLPIEVAEIIIENIKKFNPQLNMMCDVDEELIREEALESTIRYKQKRTRGLLDGVPCVVKDQISVKGLMKRDGLPFITEKSLDDAEVIRRLRKQGVILIGMTNMQQVGLGAFGNNPSPYHGECRNPHDPKCYPGGSSSGTAVAIASGLVPFGIGTDGGGSIRNPSAMCGVVGLKPTCGRIPSRATSVSGTNGVIGPMASNVNDCALLYGAMAGPDDHPDSRESIIQPKVEIPKDVCQSLEGVRIAVDYFWTSQADAPIVEKFYQVLEFLQSKGAKIVKFKMPDLDYLHVSHLVSFMAEIGAASIEHLCNGKDISLDNYVLINQIASGINATDYVTINKIRTKCMNQIRQIYKQVDYIATPTCGGLALEILNDDKICGRLDISNALKSALFSKPANFTGIPGISVPIGYSDGLPIGIQLMAPWWEEEQLFRIAQLIETNHIYLKPAVLIDNFL